MLPIQVDAADACPRYLGRVVKGINVKAPTPLWMKEKLRRCGIRSIDAVVDVTNYVLLELGQPMHAFDKDRIDGGIVVRMAKEGETLVLLDGSEAKLNADTLVIADHSKALAMGGIFGGEHSGVNDETQNVLLECAFFSPLSITGRARRHGLHTDASHRYERGVDPALQYKAMERATRLLLDICGGEAGPVIDVTNEATLPKRATISPAPQQAGSPDWSPRCRCAGDRYPEASGLRSDRRPGRVASRCAEHGVSTWKSKKIWWKKWRVFTATTTSRTSRFRPVW